ncbi:MAG TPA: class I SAM-dependent methyltransferase [Thermoanaerobaculia bacterium]|nr:class I SAM-dependent methyltransferase [Thermoanaerobaculia bacterium]
MGLYHDRIVPRLVHWALRAEEFASVRAETVRGLSGEVLEIGFGSGLNLPYYPPEVRRLLAVEPSGTAWELARTAIEAAPFPVELAGETAESIPLPDASVDAAVSTWTLCTIPDAGQALREVRRVLRPGGVFRFLEHGRSDEPHVARWQDRLTPLQKRLAGGCHINRPIGRLIEDAGFALEDMKTYYARRPKTVFFFYHGTAEKSLT